MDQGFGLVGIDTTLTTLSSPPARKLYVDGEWTSECAACPSVNDNASFDYIVQVRLVLLLVWGVKSYDASFFLCLLVRLARSLHIPLVVARSLHILLVVARSLHISPQS